MKDDLLEILCCPMCKGDLALTVGQRDADDQEILTGSLTCSGCGRVYPIDDGIPNLLPPDEDAAEA